MQNPDMKEFAKKFPYPLSFRVNQLLDALERYHDNEDNPQIAYDLCAVAGLLIRFDAAIMICDYVQETGGADSEINHLIIDKIRKPSDGSWLEITNRIILHVSGKSKSILVKGLGKSLKTKCDVSDGTSGTALCMLLSA